ncbi:hypothetical protein FIBSPDRAFT_962347 [Athelia psychrophila]|uniref:Uncharacterized protein n=1 Tax=Athelia psychrophila TaxID=1759441 RepID=A0A166A8F1_9AGAM|nr:hypothetical protein FIBSPDRAFT_962347 [Fibularhizoctonia sp. CBS 109695]
MWCEGGVEREEGRREAVHNAPIIQRLVTPIRLHRRSHLHSLRKRIIEYQKEQKTGYDMLIAKRVSENAKLAVVKGPYKTVAVNQVLGLSFSLWSYLSISCYFVSYHPPDTMSLWRQTWKGMEAMSRKARWRLSMCLTSRSRSSRRSSQPRSRVNRLELHLYHLQLNLLAYLKSEAIVAQAYSPLGPTTSPLLTDDTATAIAKKHRLQTSDTLLGYLRAQDVVFLPKLVTPARIVCLW